MEPLVIQATEDTPQIMFDASNNTLEISGKSYPDNVFSFYEPALAWLNNYSVKPGPSTKAVFKLDYFNTASAKIIFDILSILDKIHSKEHAVQILWHYKADDDDMKEAGAGYKNIIKTNIELIAC